MEQIANQSKISLKRTGPVGYIDLNGIAQISIAGAGDSTGVVELKKCHGSLKYPQSFSPAKTLTLTGVPEVIFCLDFTDLVLEVTTADADESLEVIYSTVPFEPGVLLLLNPDSVSNYTPEDNSLWGHLKGVDAALSGGGSGTFTALTDTPGSYTTAGNAMRVNSSGTALEENDWLGAICIWGEENSTIGTNTYEYAFGNGGNPDIEGPVIPFDYEVLAVGASGGSSGTWELRVQRNGSNFATDAIVTVTAATRGYATFSAGSRPQGNAGDSISFRSGTVTSSPAAPNVASCWIKAR